MQGIAPYINIKEQSLKADSVLGDMIHLPAIISNTTPSHLLLIMVGGREISIPYCNCAACSLLSYATFSLLNSHAVSHTLWNMA